MRYLTLLILALALIACMPKIQTSRETEDFARSLYDLNGEVAGVVREIDRLAGLEVSTAQDRERTIREVRHCRSQLEELRIVLLTARTPANCRSIREQYLQAIEEYERACESAHAYLITNDEAFRLDSLDARRAADRARRLTYDALQDLAPKVVATAETRAAASQ